MDLTPTPRAVVGFFKDLSGLFTTIWRGNVAGKVQNIFKEANIKPGSVELESTASLLDECSINGRKAKAEGKSISDVIIKANKDTDTALAGFNSVMSSRGMSKKRKVKRRKSYYA